MQLRRFLLLSFVPVLTACSGGVGQLSDAWSNPLFTQQYYSDLVDHYVTLQIHNDPALKDSAVAKKADKEREAALAKAQDASRKVDQGLLGTFSEASEQTLGTALSVDGNLHFGMDFYTIPGSDLRVYLTSMVDPRSGTGANAFPDTSAVDLGTLKMPSGIQSYPMPEDKKDVTNLTVVLYDTLMKRIHGFAQLRP